jgi:uncharacterized membrane protein YoaK (UPF0700 family)
MAFSQTQRWRHTVGIATLLAVAAGTVNACGFLAFGKLVANVTGHATSLGLSISGAPGTSAVVVGIWLLAFLAGAMVAGLLMRPLQRRGWTFVYAPPMALELVLLFTSMFLADWALRNDAWKPWTVALLLFAMGVQNATVTMASGAVVRTTHLTGMLTDIGLNVARLLSGIEGQERRKASYSLGLHTAIVAGFIGGAATGTFIWESFGFYTINLAVFAVTTAMAYDLLLHHREVIERRIRKLHARRRVPHLSHRTRNASTGFHQIVGRATGPPA